MIPPSTPITETLVALGMPDTPMPAHVRTCHDLIYAIARREVEVPRDVAIALGLPVNDEEEDKWHEGMGDG